MNRRDVAESLVGAGLIAWSSILLYDGSRILAKPEILDKVTGASLVGGISLLLYVFVTEGLLAERGLDRYKPHNLAHRGLHGLYKKVRGV